MNTIWKYELETTDEQLIEMPKGAKPLSVQCQFGRPCMWMEVNPDVKKELRRIVIFGTGHPLKDNEGMIYVGTYQTLDGIFIGHVFIDRG